MALSGDVGPTVFRQLWVDEATGHEWALDFILQGPVEPGGYVECVAVTIRSIPTAEVARLLTTDPAQDRVIDRQITPRAITTSVLRRIRWGDLIHTQRKSLLDLLQLIAGAPLAEWEQSDDRYGQMARASRQAHKETVATHSKRHPRPRRPARYDREHFEQVAAIYRANYEGPSAGAPTQAVAKHFAVPASTARKWVARARRQYKLLGPTRPGYAGGVELHRRSK